MYNALINTNGTTAICGLLIKYFNPKAPNNAGTTLLNAGNNTGFCNTGCNGTIKITPTAITKVVTIALVATLMVEIISCSGVPSVVPAIYLEFITQGIFMLVTFPVIKER